MELLVARLSHHRVDDLMVRIALEPLRDEVAEALALLRLGRGEDFDGIVAREPDPTTARIRPTRRHLAFDLRIRPHRATALLAAAALGLPLLALRLDGGLLVEAPTLQLFVNALLGDLTLQGLDGSLDVIAINDDLKRPQHQFIRAQSITSKNAANPDSARTFASGGGNRAAGG